MAGNTASSTKHDSPPERPGSPLRRFVRELWTQIWHRPYRNVSIIGLVVMAVILLGFGSKRIANSRPIKRPTPQLLQELLALLEAGRIEEARAIAADLRLVDDIPADSKGLPAYVLGLAMHHDASQFDTSGNGRQGERRALFLLAANYFDEARQSGFPPGQETRGTLLLGESMYRCGRFADAVAPLKLALQQNPDQASQCQAWLTECFLKLKTPDLEQARQYSERHLTDRNLLGAARERATLQHAQILFELGQNSECQQMIGQLPPGSPHFAGGMLLSGRMLLREGDHLNAGSSNAAPGEAAIEKYQLAKQAFLKAAEQDDRTRELRPQVQYLLGIAHRRLGEATEALDLLSRTKRAFLDSPEGIAAGFEEAELLHETGQEAEALSEYARVLQHAAQLKIDPRPWVSTAELRQRLERTFQTYRTEGHFDHAADLVRSYMSLFPDARTTALAASLHEQWAKQLATTASSQSGENASLTAQSRAEFREAGKLYQQLGGLRFATRDYPSDLWNSAESYFQGHDYPNAVRMYTTYLQNQVRVGRPAALVRLGESQLALNEPAKAIQSLNECIEAFPKDPFVYNARLVAAEANVELGDVDRAKQLLTTNLENDALTPQSPEWRQSLFMLGRLFFHEGTLHETQSRAKGVDSFIATERQEGMKELKLAQAAFRECTQRLAESIQREPSSSRTIEARYMLAQAHMQSAKLPKKELATVNIEATRVMLRREMQKELVAAAEAFEQLKAELNAKESGGSLTPIEQRMLRNCYFGRADALFDMGQLEEAIEAYSSATSRYQHEPESLEAYVQIANCQRKLRRHGDSRRTLDQAKAVLNRIRPEANFLVTTRYDRKEWNDLLNWLSTL